jgi:hypothetical protein
MCLARVLHRQQVLRSWLSSSRRGRRFLKTLSHECTLVKGAPAYISETWKHLEATNQSCFSSAAVFLAQLPPSRFKGYSARPFSFLSPEAP